MSCSSCSRMWQCQTYSFPPVRGLTALRIAAVGRVGRLNCMMTVVTSPGFIRTVSIPSNLVRIRWDGIPRVCPVIGGAHERLPLNQLYVDQVEVNGMSVA